MNLLRWWRSRGQAARFDFYVRASFYVNFLVFPMLAAGAVDADLDGAAPWVAGALTTVHTGACILLVRAGLAHHLGRSSRPTVLIAVAGAMTVAGAVATVLAFPGPDSPGNALLTVIVVAYVAALTIAAPPRVALGAGAVGCAALYGFAAAHGASNPFARVLGMAAAVLFVVGIGRASMWTLAVVWELDRARHLQASLAVAEERLRFSRDLHDVVGRTLSAVALKAELAAQLARRGRAEAIDEMLEVRRIAEESMTELRAVVGGYRTAELDVELAGARSLLDSAGIGCRVVGDGAGLPAAVQSGFGWVVREGATNMLRHSEATTCTITLRPGDDGTVTLTMVNDGVTGRTAGGGTGIVGLTERIAALGGTVTAAPEPPGRFRLTARLPIGTPA
ncbi:sensor histidine kinase [Phytohabitans rumicis]|uniref:Histidine kinase n=1 Tax=Phytohabitans rumicis TaxID=1076125 RepID=A0A6V8KVL0_9ACTN|nr:histidine kinase [Phytohabitans rumicis]GFJ86441.1 histidine kinase [Phytohabitans rumicis]